MAQLRAGMSPVELPPNCTVVFEAIDPTTGAAVSGVTLSNVTVSAEADAPVTLEPVPVFPPLFVYGPNV